MYTLPERWEVQPGKLPGVQLLAPPPQFWDHRGIYQEIYNREALQRLGLDYDWKEEDISCSKRNVLRGLHGDNITWKLVSCLFGCFQLVILCNDPISPHFGEWESHVMTPGRALQVLIPPSHANGHLVLSDQAIFHYRQSEYYDRERQFTLRYDDPRFNIQWRRDASTPLILSGRDDHVEAA